MIMDLSVIANPLLVIYTREKYHGAHVFWAILTFCDYRLYPPCISILWTGGSEWQIQVENGQLASLIYELAVHILVVAIRYCQEITQYLAEDFCTVEKHLHPLD